MTPAHDRDGQRRIGHHAVIAADRLAANQATNTLEPFDPLDPQLKIDPFPIYERYRREDPVHWGRSYNPRLPGTWYLFGYEEHLDLWRLGQERPARVGAIPPRPDGT